jgi:hypothetical protein
MGIFGLLRRKNKRQSHKKGKGHTSLHASTHINDAKKDSTSKGSSFSPTAALTTDSSSQLGADSPVGNQQSRTGIIHTTRTRRRTPNSDAGKEEHVVRFSPSTSSGGGSENFLQDQDYEPTLERLPQLIYDLESSIKTSSDKPTRALRNLFTLSENGPSSNSNRTDMVHLHHQKLVPALFNFLLRCRRGSSEQYLTLLVLNNISIPSANKRVRELFICAVVLSGYHTPWRERVRERAVFGQYVLTCLFVPSHIATIQIHVSYHLCRLWHWTIVVPRYWLAFCVRILLAISWQLYS